MPLDRSRSDLLHVIYSLVQRERLFFLWVKLELCYILWECHHVCLYVLTAPPLRSTGHDMGTAGAGGPEKGRIVYGEFSGPILALLDPVADGPEKGRIVYGEFLGPLGQRQAGFGGQRAGSRPS
jgi:hypothetical protein